MKKQAFILVSFCSAALLAGCSFFPGSQTNPPQVITQVVTQTEQGSQTNQPTEILNPTPITPPKPVPLSTCSDYKDPKYNFELCYPKTFTLSKNIDVNNVISLDYPSVFSQGTNLNYARIDVNQSSDTANCYVNPYTSTRSTTTSVNNGTTYYSYDWKEGAAGHIGDQIVYATIQKGLCFKYNLVMYYSNMQMYSNGQGGYLPGAPKEFNRVGVATEFNNIFKTFKFI